ncbi:hypothetical protein CEP52_013302 [Fusarium oligoseptatum]|uniref:Uncharacterized protein n=1 Tax=Fusarium oligoseptatum TaxID=2604345 RepID=A0A428SU48_9HYPO|nr:hypothetical protein CEP52_013302 [Fusarium oligoseptatum]
MSSNLEAKEMSKIDNLPESHRNTFRGALRNILSTDIAEHTYAQILDGLPTVESQNESYPILDGHPVYELDHRELCEGSLDKAHEFRTRFDPSDLLFKEQSINAFGKTAPGSREFNLRLIELIVVACHQIAAYLFGLDDGVHKHRVFDDWLQQQLVESILNSRNGKANSGYKLPPSAFFHSAYTYVEEYPQGLGDVAGYWAEGKIFGGVVVFDRGETEQECKAIWMDGARWKGPHTLYPPTKDQFDSLVRFLLSEANEEVPCPFPIHGTDENRPRWHPWHAFSQYHIFRDRYEKKMGPDPPRPRCTLVLADWPETSDYWVAINHEILRREGATITDEDIAAAQLRLKEVTPSSPYWGYWNPS